MRGARRHGRWLLVCYVAALAGWLAFSAGRLMVDRAAMQGKEATPAPAAAARNDLQPVDGATWMAAGGDPWLLFEVEGAGVRTVDVSATYIGWPGEVCLYYTADPGGIFQAERRVFPKWNPDGSFRFTLPAGDHLFLRFDPAMYAGVCIQDMQITFNRELPWTMYFTPSGLTVFLLLFGPGVAASGGIALYRAGRFCLSVIRGAGRRVADGNG